MAAEPTLMRRLAWRLEAAAFDLAGALLRLLPLDAASALGASLFAALGPLTPSHGIARRNIRLAFPELTPEDEKALLDAQWRSLGRGFFEFQLMERLAADPSRIELEHGERLQEIARTGAPTVLIAGHFSNWEVMAVAIMQAGVNCRVTYRAANNPYIDARIREVRARYGIRLFAPKGSDGAREALEGLRRGESIALMNDQKFNGGVASPLFGHPAHTATGPTKLAMKIGRPLQPLSITRTRGARFKVRLHEPIAVPDTGDRAADVAACVAAINRFVETVVREHPAEWFWVHRRWPREEYAPPGKA
jgi:KDO2-lipid IV(A) lauroyltransferase